MVYEVIGWLAVLIRTDFSGLVLAFTSNAFVGNCFISRLHHLLLLF